MIVSLLGISSFGVFASISFYLNAVDGASHDAVDSGTVRVGRESMVSGGLPTVL